MKKVILNEVIFPSCALSLKIAIDALIGSRSFDKNEIACVFSGGILLSTLLYSATASWSPLANHPSKKLLIELTTPLLAPTIGQYLCPSSLSPFIMLKHQAIGILIELCLLYGLAMTALNLQIIRQHYLPPDLTYYSKQVSTVF